MSEFSLKSITRSVVVRPPRMVLLGVEKVGKSTFAAGAPDVVFVPVALEEGIDALDVARFPAVQSFEDLGEVLQELLDGDHAFKTVVIDSASALEPLIYAAVCAEHGKKNIEDFGYGKGYTFALEKWRMLMELLDEIRSTRNMAVILIGHVKVKPFNDPERPSYDQYQFDINEKAASALYRWADVIGFANFSVSIVAEEAGFNKKKIKAEDDNIRYIHTTKSAVHPGGGRGVYGQLEDDVELSWDAFQAAVDAALEAQKPKKKKSTKK